MTRSISLSQISLFRSSKILWMALAIAISAGYLYWKYRPYHPLEAASKQAAVVLFVGRGMSETAFLFNSKETLASQLQWLQRYRQEVASAVKVLLPEAAQWWAAHPHAAVFSLMPNDSLHPLLVIDMGAAAQAQQVLSEPAGLWAKYRFKGNDVYECRNPNGTQWVAAITRNVLLVSRFSYLVEEALVQLQRRDDWWLEQAALTEAPLAVLIRSEAVAKRAQSVLATEWREVALTVTSAVEAVTWGIYPDSSEVVVCVSAPIRAGKALTRGPFSAVLPDNVALYTWRVSEQAGEALAALAQPERNFSDFQRYVLPWCGREAGLVWLEPQAGGAGFDCAWVCSVLSETEARRLLDAYGSHSGMVRRYAYHVFEIRQFLNPSLIEPLLFGGAEAHFQSPACALLDGYAVFAPSAAALELWLDKYLANQTLANSEDYLTLLSRQGDASQWAVFANGRHLSLLVPKLLDASALGLLHAEARQLATLGLVGLDFKPAGRRLWRAVALRQVSSSTLAVSLMWKASLPAPVIGTPQVIEPSAAEPLPLVLVQDESGQLHCLAPGGGRRWSKPLGQPIRSRVSVLEDPSTRQRHYAFSTTEALWILDADGREALGFPLRLQSPATNGVIAVPLESARRYGLFIACANGNLYGFDAFGRPLQGWNPKSGAGRVAHPLLHFTASNRDYLVALDAEGRLLCADRLGKPHFPDLQLPGPFTATPPLCLWDGGTPYITCINDAGRIFRCTTAGQVSEEVLGWGVQGHLGAAASTSSSAFIAIASGARVRVAKLARGKATRQGEQLLPGPLNALWAVGDKGFGGLSLTQQRIFLLDFNGRIVQGFPLGGTTPFALSDANDAAGQWLAVGYGTDVYAYRLMGQ